MLGVTGAQCAQKMSKYDIALRWVEDGLLLDSTHQELLKMRAACEKSKVWEKIFKTYHSTIHD